MSATSQILLYQIGIIDVESAQCLGKTGEWSHVCSHRFNLLINPPELFLPVSSHELVLNHLLNAFACLVKDNKHVLVPHIVTAV